MIEQWLTAVRDHPDRPPPGQQHVLTMLALRMNWATGAGFASAQMLADDASTSRITVWRATKWAVKAGLLTQTRRGHRITAETTIASGWQLTQRFTTETLAATQRFNGDDPTFQSGRPNVSPVKHYQESSTSRSSSSGHARVAGTIRAVFPDATDDEIENLTGTIKRAGARNPAAYIAALAGNGDLRLPCDRDSGTRHSDACRQGDSDSCTAPWCDCRCHAGQETP